MLCFDVCELVYAAHFICRPRQDELHSTTGFTETRSGTDRRAAAKPHQSSSHGACPQSVHLRLPTPAQPLKSVSLLLHLTPSGTLDTLGRLLATAP